MNLVQKIRRGVRHPSRIRRKLKILSVRPFTKPESKSLPFLERDWDNLIILDACRYDLFKEHNPFKMTMGKIHSNATQTREYIENNFLDRECLDTVYVTASPQFADFDLEFAHIEHVWSNYWDEEHRTVLPESVTDTAIELSNQFNNKRLVIHYMQPHYPFIGPTGQKLTKQATFGSNSENLSVWEQLSAGIVGEDEVRTAYAENLSIVLPEVNRLINHLKGKTVISSDHGNLFGQRVCWLPVNIYGHPAGVHHADLTEVPWVELPYENRKKVVRAEKSTETNKAFDAVEERLEDLGYVQ